MPGVDFTITPVSELCPDRATAELMTLTAKLGALMPYRAAAEVLADFLPGQTPTRHTTLRHRTLAIGKRLEENLLLGLDELTYRQAHWDFCCCATPTTW
jgi:hypothetical protein